MKNQDSITATAEEQVELPEGPEQRQELPLRQRVLHAFQKAGELRTPAQTQADVRRFYRRS